MAILAKLGERLYEFQSASALSEARALYVRADCQTQGDLEDLMEEEGVDYIIEDFGGSVGLSLRRGTAPSGSVHPLVSAAQKRYSKAMKFTDSCSPEAVALTAACQLHSELLEDEAFAGYDGTKAAFDSLYSELFVIARDEVSLEVEPVEQVVETWYQYQAGVSDGSRDFDWFL